MGASWVNINKCTECGDYYTTHEICPNCGKPTQSRKTAQNSGLRRKRVAKGSNNSKSALEAQFAAIYRVHGKDLPSLKAEYRFHPVRKWRFDFAIPEYMIAIELEGGVWSGGRHTRGKGFIEDCNKYNAATVLGWRVLRYTSDHVGNYPLAMVQQVRAIVEYVKLFEDAA